MAISPNDRIQLERTLRLLIEMESENQPHRLHDAQVLYRQGGLVLLRPAAESLREVVILDAEFLTRRATSLEDAIAIGGFMMAVHLRGMEGRIPDADEPIVERVEVPVQLTAGDRREALHVAIEHARATSSIPDANALVENAGVFAKYVAGTEVIERIAFPGADQEPQS